MPVLGLVSIIKGAAALFYESRRVLTIFLCACLLCCTCVGALADGTIFEPERASAVQEVYWQVDHIAVNTPEVSAHKAFSASSTAEGVASTVEGEVLPGYEMEQRLADGASITLDITRLARCV